MKPQDLKWPFERFGKKYLIQDRVWYVPLRSDDPFHFPGFSDPLFFEQEQPVKVEYCSGNGLWIAAKAAAEPQFNFIAIERKFDRVRKIWSKIQNLGLKNLFVICGEGFHVTRSFFKDESIAHVYINFPDPWPKTRHFKNRIVQPEFVHEIARVLQKKGEFQIVTDDPSFSEWTTKHLLKSSSFTSIHPDPFYITSLDGYGTSYFEELWREKGRTIRYHEYQKLGV